MANSVDPEQTAPIGAVCSGSALFAHILNSSVMLGNYLQQTTSADDIFSCIFFLGALRIKPFLVSSRSQNMKMLSELFAYILGSFSCSLCCQLIFFKINFFEKFFQECVTIKWCQMVRIQIRINILSVLICVQTTCKGVISRRQKSPLATLWESPLSLDGRTRQLKQSLRPR